MFKTSGENTEVLDEYFDRTGAVVVGRRMFDVAQGWGGHSPLKGVPAFVVTHRVPEELSGEGSPFTFVTDGIESAIGQAKAAAGDKVVAIGGADIAQQSIRAGFVDEIQIHVAPLLLGAGVRLFDDAAPEPIELEPTRVVEAPGIAHLRYRVWK